MRELGLSPGTAISALAPCLLGWSLSWSLHTERTAAPSMPLPRSVAAFSLAVEPFFCCFLSFRIPRSFFSIFLLPPVAQPLAQIDRTNRGLWKGTADRFFCVSRKDKERGKKISNPTTKGELCLTEKDVICTCPFHKVVPQEKTSDRK